jgi:hypothetical protein
VKDFTAAYAIGAHVVLDPPKAQVVGVAFRGGPDGMIQPYYILAIRGQIVENIPGADIIGLDPDAADTFGASVDKANDVRAIDAADEAQQG